MLRTLYALEGESAYSFMHRNAVANRYDNLASIFPPAYVHRFNLNYQTESNFAGKEAASLIKELDEEPNRLFVNPLVDLMYDHEPSVREFREKYLQIKTRYCPSCMQESFYHRRIWDVACVTACLKHNVYLTEKCPSCRANITMSRLMNNRCKCGHLFSEEGETLQPPSAAVIDMQRAMQGLLTGEIESVDVHGQKLTAKEFFQLHHAFCDLVHRFSGALPLVKSTGIEVEKVVHFNRGEDRGIKMNTLLGALAYPFIVHPSDELLHQLFQATDGPTLFYTQRRKIMAAFHFIFGSKLGSFYTQSYDRYMESIDKNSSKLYKLMRQMSKKEFSKEYYSYKDAAAHLHSDMRNVQKMVEKGWLPREFIYHNGKKITVLNKRAVDKFGDKLDSCYDVVQLAEMFGLHRTTVTQLMKEGILEETHGPVTDGYYKSLVHHDALQCFIKRVFTLAEPILAPTIPISSALTTFKRYELKYVDILKCVLSGEFHAGTTVSGNFHFDHIVLSKTEFDRMVRSYKNERNVLMGYSPQEFADVTGLNRDRVWRRMLKGEIHAEYTTGPNGNKSWFIPHSELMKFQSLVTYDEAAATKET